MSRERKPTAKRRGEPSKRFPLNLRTTAERRASLEIAADRSGRSLIQEVEHRLDLAAWLLEQLGREGVELDDLFDYRARVALTMRALAEAGEDPAMWRDYIATVPFSANIKDPGVAAHAFEMLRAEVIQRYRESSAYCAAHPAPAPDAYAKHLPGTASPARWLADNVQALEHRNRVLRIEANSPAWLQPGASTVALDAGALSAFAETIAARPEPCTDCGVPSTSRVLGKPYCHEHAAAARANVPKPKLRR